MTTLSAAIAEAIRVTNRPDVVQVFVVQGREDGLDNQEIVDSIEEELIDKPTRRGKTAHLN